MRPCYMLESEIGPDCQGGDPSEGKNQVTMVSSPPDSMSNFPEPHLNHTLYHIQLALGEMPRCSRPQSGCTGLPLQSVHILHRLPYQPKVPRGRAADPLRPMAQLSSIGREGMGSSILGAADSFLSLARWQGPEGPGEGCPFSPAESWLGGRHPCSQGSAGRAGKGKAVALVEVGRGGEGSRLCSVQRCSAKGARLTYSLCPSQGGACFSLRVEVPVRELCLKSCALSLSVGLTMPPPAWGGGCQRGGDPPWRVSAQKPWQNASKLGTQHTSATAGRGSSLFREAGTKRNEFPDCSILLPGP